MKTETENCESCVFKHVDQGQAICRRRPPALVTIPTINPITKQSDTMVLTAFPQVKKHFWCGEYLTTTTITTTTILKRKRF